MQENQGTYANLVTPDVSMSWHGHAVGQWYVSGCMELDRRRICSSEGEEGSKWLYVRGLEEMREERESVCE